MGLVLDRYHLTFGTRCFVRRDHRQPHVRKPIPFRVITESTQRFKTGPSATLCRSDVFCTSMSNQQETQSERQVALQELEVSINDLDSSNAEPIISALKA